MPKSTRIIKTIGFGRWRYPEFFSVSSAYKEIHLDLVGSQNSNLMQDIWWLKVQPKAVFLMWRMMLNKLPTKDNLRIRNISLIKRRANVSFVRYKLPTKDNH